MIYTPPLPKGHVLPGGWHQPGKGERLVITGSRDWTDRGLMCEVLSQIWDERPFGVLIHGDARGADRMGRDWAVDNGIHVQPFPADWHQYGKAAGSIRNQEMIDKGLPTIAAAFPLEGSVGTWDMVRRLITHDIPILYQHGKGWLHV